MATIEINTVVICFLSYLLCGLVVAMYELILSDSVVVVKRPCYALVLVVLTWPVFVCVFLFGGRRWRP
jgi:hypothetical protein